MSIFYHVLSIYYTLAFSMQMCTVLKLSLNNSVTSVLAFLKVQQVPTA